jgi:hypothetical protein
VLPIPAEKFQADLKFDTIVCWNTIDHAVGWRDILLNIALYSKPTTRIGISTDFHEPYDGHPGFEKKEFMAEITRLFVIIECKEPFGRDIALLLKIK